VYLKAAGVRVLVVGLPLAPTLFEHACRLGLEGIVSKRIDAPYRSGRAKCWIKIKNKKRAQAFELIACPKVQ
jgi:ATP-dependent DNA ligase